MSDLFRFPVQESLYLKAALPYEMKSTLGMELSQIYQTEQMTGLFQNQMEIAQANVYTQEEKERIWDYSQIGWGERYMAARTQEEKQALLEERETLKEKKKEVEAEIASKYIDEGRMLDEATLTSMYGDILEIDRPMTPAEAAVLYEGKKKEAIRNNILARGEATGFAAGAARFGTAFLSVATDPLELGIGFISALAVPWTGGTLGTRFVVGAAEGFLGSALTEPIYYTLSKRQQLDYSMNEALLNVGLGTLLGGAIGGIFGPRLGDVDYGGTAGMMRLPEDGANILTSLERDKAHVAARQFINDELVDLSVFGRDLRSTTSIVSSRGIEFQPVAREPEYLGPLMRTEPEAPPPPPPPPPQLTSLVMGPDGTPMRFGTVQKADVAAAKVSGAVFRNADGTYTIRQPIDGVFVRNPVGDPLTFPTRRSAEKFINSTRSDLLPEGAAVVPLRTSGGPDLFGVAGGMDKSRLAEISGGNAGLKIPKGVDTRAPVLKPEPEPARSLDAELGPTLRVRKAYEQLGRDLAEQQQNKPVGSIPVAPDLRSADKELSEYAEEIEFYKTMIDEKDMPDTSSIETRLEAKKKGIQATIACMARL